MYEHSEVNGELTDCAQANDLLNLDVPEITISGDDEIETSDVTDLDTSVIGCADERDGLESRADEADIPSAISDASKAAGEAIMPRVTNYGATRTNDQALHTITEVVVEDKRASDENIPQPSKEVTVEPESIISKIETIDDLPQSEEASSTTNSTVRDNDFIQETDTATGNWEAYPEAAGQKTTTEKDQPGAQMLQEMRDFFREHPKGETFAGAKMQDLVETLAPTLDGIGNPETQERFVKLWHAFTKELPQSLRTDLVLAQQVYAQYNGDVEQLRQAGFERNPQSIAKFNDPSQLLAAMREFGDAPMAKLLANGRPSDPAGVARDYYEQYPLHPPQYPGDEAAEQRKENAEPRPSMAELRDAYKDIPEVEERIIKRFAEEAKPRESIEKYVDKHRTLAEHFGNDPDFSESTIRALALRYGAKNLVQEGAAWKERYHAIQEAALDATSGDSSPRAEALRLAVVPYKGPVADRLGYARYLDKIWSEFTIAASDEPHDTIHAHKAGRGIGSVDATPEQLVVEKDERQRQVTIAKDLISDLTSLERRSLFAHYGFFTETTPEELASEAGEELGAYVNRVVIPKLRAEAARFEQTD